ncbi:MAG: hypothetical protein KYX64_11530 [Sphingopyxis sp.]|nr:hypothetical protein [Sphingopyxis sp.]
MRSIYAVAAACAIVASPVGATDSVTDREPQQSAASAPRTPADHIAPNFRLSGDEVSFPFVVVQGIPFVEATINGVRGKLMLDTGARAALSLNSNRIPLTGGKPAGQGLFGSGQRFSTLLHDKIDAVEVGGLSFRDVTTVESQEEQMLEGITPDFAGWLGFNFWRGYALKLDYQKNIATFYRDESPAKGQMPKFLAGETVRGVIRYETPKLPNIPLVKVRIGSQSIDGLFDTGNDGYIWIDAALREQMTSDGTLKPAQPEGESVILKDVVIEGAGTYTMPVGVLSSPFPAATPIGTTTPSVIAFGYTFLNQYKTVWDFTGKTIYLLEKLGCR